MSMQPAACVVLASHPPTRPQHCHLWLVSANDGWRPFVSFFFFLPRWDRIMDGSCWWTEWTRSPRADKNKIRQNILSTDGFIIGKNQADLFAVFWAEKENNVCSKIQWPRLMNKMLQKIRTHRFCLFGRNWCGRSVMFRPKKANVNRMLQVGAK